MQNWLRALPRGNCLAHRVLIALAAMAGSMVPGMARADATSATAQQTNNQAQLAAVDSIATQLAMVRTAAEQWVAANVTSVWNQTQSITPYAFGTSPPILLYVGADKGLCGAPASISQTIDLVASGYVTANFTTPYSGEYCAMVYPDSGTATSAGPVGPNGGTNLVPITTVLSYFVAGEDQDQEEILQNATSDYAVSHIAPLLQSNFASGGVVQKYTPVITNNGQGDSAWQAIGP